jgi:hypothetical protein
VKTNLFVLKRGVNKLKRIRLILFIILIIFLFTITLYAKGDLYIQTDEYDNLRLGNDYIVIVVNKDQNGLGRFAIETTGGAPFRDNDDYKPLVYGRPKPWTSYTSIWINDKKFVFGGKTERRAGRSGKYGIIKEGPIVKDGSIYTSVKIDNILVEQILTIVKSSTTGLYDSVQIKYRVENMGLEKQKLGLRIMLDTMLGENDGAPFRIGTYAITSDQLFLKDQLPSFWQAFDSISKPNVTSQGTFISSEVTAPDKVYLSDWGSLADGVWDFDFNPGQDFIRKGEFETDSAIALYWIPEYLEPGAVKTYISNYGLGGITIVPGLLSLGVTSPAEFTFNNNASFPIIVYLENTSEIEAKAVKLKLFLPDSLTTNNIIRELGNLKPGEIAQLVWDVNLKGKDIPSIIEYEVLAEAENTDSNKVRRNIKFIGPPELKAEVQVLEELIIKKGKLMPNPFPINLKIKNTGGSTLYNLSAGLVLPPGLILAPKELSKKYPVYLEAGDEIDVKWYIKALDIDGDLPIAFNIKGLNDCSLTLLEEINIPAKEPLLYLEKNSEKDKNNNDYFKIDIKGENLQEINSLIFSLKYDPAIIMPIYVSRGNIFLKEERFLPWNNPSFNNGLINFKLNFPDDINSGILASIHFKIIKEGDITIKWNKYNVLDENDNKLTLKVLDL